MPKILLCITGIVFLAMGIVCGCAPLGRQAQERMQISSFSSGSLKGLNKVDIAKKFGQPLATSTSGVSECWYYAQPREIWIWFNKDNKVTRWEVKQPF